MPTASATTLTHVRRDDQERKEAPLNLAIIKRLLEFTRPYAFKRNCLLAIVVLRSIQMPALAWVLSIVIKGPISDLDFRGTLWGAAGFLALGLFTVITLHFRMKLALELGESVVHDLRNRIFEHLQRMSMNFYDRTKLGRIISRMSSDAERVRTGVQDVLFVTLVQTGQMIVAAAVMMYYDILLFGIILVMAPILWVITRYFRSRLSVAYRARQESFSRITATLAETVNGVRVTQGFVRQDENTSLFGNQLQSHFGYNLDAAKLMGVFLPLLQLNNQFFTSILLILGGYQVIHAGLGASAEPATQMAHVWPFFFMLPQFLNPVSKIGRQYNQALTAMAGAERVFGLLDQEPERLDDENAVNLPRIEGRVEFRDVGFSYVADTPVLFDLNFVANPGQTIALVGATGSGKSSVIKLISKFYLPSEGQVLIDGEDIRGIRSDSLLRQVGIVLQQNFLFTGTVIDNIRMGKADATDEQVFEAARQLDCLDLFEAMPDGFYTEVGERGGSLSLGQRQLVCFTRAMLADPRVLILDEATSSVDTMTEARIQRALSVLLTDRTSFVVAHRLSTIRHADCVLVLDGGRIVERGTHNELLAEAGIYANLYRQFIHASEA